MAFLLAAAYERKVTIPMPPLVDLSGLPGLVATGRHLDRPKPAPRRTGPPLGRLVADLPAATVPSGADPAAVLAYAELLDRVLEDRAISADEAMALCQLAGSWGLGAEQLRAIHRSYLTGLVDVALADDRLTREEHEDLGLFAELLGVDRQAVLADITGR
ncbi:MAG: hypothetical protein LC799_23080 [Actinobacteria bacterium]|nr:hypothetical protein [Actinomycetota bacterium]